MLTPRFCFWWWWLHGKVMFSSLSFLFCIMGPIELLTAVCKSPGRQPTAGTFVGFVFVLFLYKEMRQSRTGGAVLWHYVWGQGNIRRIKVKCIPSHYQKHFTKMPHLEFAWVYIYCSKMCDFRTFSETWRSLDCNEQFPISHHIFTKEGNESYQAAVVFQELKAEKLDVLMHQKPLMVTCGQV